MTDAVADLATAALIRHPLDDPRPDAPASVLHTTLKLDAGHGPVVSARLAATAHGVYEATIDGHPVSASVLNPGWTSYEWRLQVQSFDVTDLVRDGAVLAFTVGNGWWRGKLGFADAQADYGPDTGVAASLIVRFSDGHEQRVVTDASWLATTGPVRANNLYHGQHLDFTHVPEPDQPVALGSLDAAALVPQTGPLIGRHEVIAPVKVWTSPSGATLVDFGQNLVGWLRFTVRGERGATLTLRHAEVLEDGELGVRPLRAARQTDTITLSGARTPSSRP
ncbi:family 78 glycoside hydrolase catalytic domain [Propioniciclava coleopterorum]|uniref:family 78 glycoside hydrolase catalytic domain n=1 Tax=Propioniciclava coleopterorum TaxID=2714937 RepID=UPI0019812A69|nr:family 78 glycoside hydrolase catalytic domain [Propioniciclava coleopterorum]